jgi:hypothetical protein
LSRTPPDDQTRIRIRKLYSLVREALINSAKVKDNDFVDQLRRLSNITVEIGGTNSYTVKEAASKASQGTDSPSIQSNNLINDKVIKEKGAIHRDNSFLALKLTYNIANAVVFSPAPSFSDMGNKDKEDNLEEEMPVLAIEIEHIGAYSKEADEDTRDVLEEGFKGFPVEEFKGDTRDIREEEGSENSKSHYESCEKGQ